MKQEVFTTYCPFDFEDIILTAAFKDISNGYYVDIGANDPTLSSVTKHLHDNKNWHGINIEPLKYEYSLLCKDRPNDINLNIGISDKQNELVLYMDGGTSTFNKDVINQNKDIDLMNKTTVKLYTLTEVLDKYLEKGTDIFVCKIDVEGFEKNVLNGIDFKKYRPFLFCIESTFPNTDIPSYHLWEKILIDNDYSLVFSYNVNRYYADINGKMYNTILKNLNIKNNPSKSLSNTTTNLNCNETKQNNINKYLHIILNKLSSLYHLLPFSFRKKIFQTVRLPIRAKKLIKTLNLQYKIKINKY